jgi:hypothetical protein
MKFNTNVWSTSLANTTSGNGRGMDNRAASAARSLGYKVNAASATSKFVEVQGSNGTTLLAYYGDWGGFQLEFSSAEVAEEASHELDCEMAPKSNGKRIALGKSERALAKALAFVIGAADAGALAPKAEVQAPVAPVKAATASLVQALIVNEDDEIAALQAKIAEIKAKKADKAAKIAALQAELEALSAEE